MSRILLMFASHFGQTEKIAVRLSVHLRHLGHQVELVNARAPHGPMPAPEHFDVAVLGSRVEMGHHATEIIGFLRANREQLTRIPTAFFSVSMAAARANAGTDPDGYMQAMFDEIGWHPTLARALAGGLPYRKYGLILRFIMKRISKSAGNTTDTSRDHELTDWDAVRVLAEAISGLTTRPHPTSNVVPLTPKQTR